MPVDNISALSNRLIESMIPVRMINFPQVKALRHVDTHVYVLGQNIPADHYLMDSDSLDFLFRKLQVSCTDL